MNNITKPHSVELIDTDFKITQGLYKQEMLTEENIKVKYTIVDKYKRLKEEEIILDIFLDKVYLDNAGNPYIITTGDISIAKYRLIEFVCAILNKKSNLYGRDYMNSIRAAIPERCSGLGSVNKED
jgi:hypothetical protein